MPLKKRQCKNSQIWKTLPKYKIHWILIGQGWDLGVAELEELLEKLKSSQSIKMNSWMKKTLIKGPAYKHLILTEMTWILNSAGKYWPSTECEYINPDKVTFREVKEGNWKGIEECWCPYLSLKAGSQLIPSKLKSS